MTNAELITNFYKAFADGDAEGMVDFYHTDIQFQDPAFGVLKNEDANYGDDRYRPSILLKRMATAGKNFYQ